ncbi:FAD:protein FMN transferase [Bacteroidota bacterium]
MKRCFQFLLMFLSLSIFSQQVYKKEMILMGCVFDITVVANSQELGDTYIKMATDEISRIEKIISSWDKKSETSLVNKYAGVQAVKVSKELVDLVFRAKKISVLTDGAFDISYASMDRIWKFDGSITKMPSKELISKSVEKVGYENIILDKKLQTIFLKKEGMKIGFGAIGKGYAADMAKALLIKNGVVAGVVNASGDMNTWGKDPQGREWTVAITNPKNKKQAFAVLPISNKAVVTSGNYEKFILLNNERYAHIIDPRTGYPSKGILSVSVFADSAELADALATSVFVMGVEVGLDRINQLKGVECAVVDVNGKLHLSNKLNLKTWENHKK